MDYQQAITQESRVAIAIAKCRLPTPLAVVAATILIINVVLMFAGALTIGVSWDEPIHVSRLQSWIDNGWFLPVGYVADGSPADWVEDTFVYGPVMALIAHFAAVAAGAQELSYIAGSAEAYAARHFAVASMGALGLLAVAGIARLLLGSWRWGLLAATALSSVPMWTGHAMFNVKDIPVATGYTLVTLGLVALARPAAPSQPKWMWSAIAIVTTGIFIAVGTRPGMWTAILASFVVMLAGSWWVAARRLGGLSASLLTLWRAGALAGAALASFFLLLGVYPAAFADPLTLAWQSASSSANYPADGWMITAGIRHGQPPPWWYAPMWLTNQFPLLLLAFSLVGVSLGLVTVGRALVCRGSTHQNTDLSVGMMLVLTQALLVPLLAVAVQSQLYDGIRQLLLIVPAWMLMATFGFWWCLQTAALVRRGRKIALVGVGTLISTAFLLPAVDQVRLFPYSYAYFNEIATLQPINDRWPTDYWRTSLKELSGGIPSVELPVCQADTRVSDCTSPLQAAPYLRESKVELAPVAGFWLVESIRNGIDIPANCDLVDRVTRPLRHQSIVMGFLARCEVVVFQIPPDGVRFTPETGGEYLLDGWILPVGESGAWSQGEVGQIGFKIPENLRGRDLLVSLVGTRFIPVGETRNLEVFINEHSVENVVLREADGVQHIVVEVPAQIAGSLGDGRVVIALQTPDPVAPSAIGMGTDMRPLGFLLESVAVTGRDRL